MNLSEYQVAALATAQPRAFDLQYLIPMIVGEIGELFGQKAKSHWHGWDADKLQQELVSEYGDIAWGTAILLSTDGVQEVPPAAFHTETDPWQSLLSSSHAMHLFYTAKGYRANRLDWIVQEAGMLWSALEYHCQTITGATFDDVLANNLVKLQGRVQRGTLLGQGDHR